MQRSIGKAEGYIQEMMNGQKVVKVFSREKICEEDFEKINDELYKDSLAIVLDTSAKHLISDDRYQTAKDVFIQIRRLGDNPLAAVPSPKQMATDARSQRNRRERPPSRSFFPIALGIACAVCFVGLVSVFYGLDALNFGAPGTSSLKVPDSVGVEYSEGIIEELGFIGAAFVLVLYALLIYRGYKIGMKCQSKFGMLLVVGIMVQIGLQTILNVFVVTDFFPNTGISLPFFSAGGTSVSLLMASTGIILNVSRTHR